MAFRRKPRKREERPASAAGGGKRPGYGNRFAVEVWLLAARAREAGMARGEVASLVGANPSTIDGWLKLYPEGGPDGLVRQGTHSCARRLCETLESRIAEFRREHLEAGVRRIRDAPPREEGPGVIAETVRRVVNEAGLGGRLWPAILDRFLILGESTVAVQVAFTKDSLDISTGGRIVSMCSERNAVFILG